MITFEGFFPTAYIRPAYRGVALDPTDDPKDTFWTIDEWFEQEVSRQTPGIQRQLRNVRIRVEIEEAT